MEKAVTVKRESLRGKASKDRKENAFPKGVRFGVVDLAFLLCFVCCLALKDHRNILYAYR